MKQTHTHTSEHRTTKKLPPAKRRLFITVTLLLPVAALLLLEGVLRIADYGPDVSLFSKTTVRGVDHYAMNGGVRARYFSAKFFGGRSIAANTAPEYFVMPKPAGTYRVFCLGGSTTAGYPYGVLGSFSRFLQDRLQRIFPDRNVEVIDLGITATNSFTVLDMARDVVDYAPDLVIVYDGHNEFYGALGVASRESAGRLRSFGLAYMRLTRVKTFLLLTDIVDRVRNAFTAASGEDLSGTAMERLAKGQTIPYGSQLYSTGLEWYRENMEETRRICADRGVPVIFSSQVSNLKDLQPFVSEFAEATSTERRERFSREFDEGIGALNRRDTSGALPHFRAAAGEDSTRADARFRLAQCLEAAGDIAGARREYVAARDFDQLRFRQSSDFNEAVRSMQGRGAYVCDCEQYFVQESPRGLIGTNLILEHLHPNLYGYFLLAKAYARTMREHGMIASQSEWNGRDTVTDLSLWNGRIISPLDEAIGARRIAILTSSWPFVQGPRTGMPQAGGGPIESIANDVIAGTITWERGMVEAAEYFQRQGRVNEAAACYRSLIVHTPFNPSPYVRLGALLLEHGRTDEAARVLGRSLESEPTHLAYQMLGRIAYERSRFDEAVGLLQQAKQHASSVSERSDASLGLALSLLRKGDVGAARSELEYLLSFNPSSAQARGLLNQIRSTSN